MADPAYRVSVPDLSLLSSLNSMSICLSRAHRCARRAKRPASAAALGATPSGRDAAPPTSTVCALSQRSCASESQLLRQPVRYRPRSQRPGRDLQLILWAGEVPLEGGVEFGFTQRADQFHCQTSQWQYPMDRFSQSTVSTG